MERERGREGGREEEEKKGEILKSIYSLIPRPKEDWE